MMLSCAARLVRGGTLSLEIEPARATSDSHDRPRHGARPGDPDVRRKVPAGLLRASHPKHEKITAAGEERLHMRRDLHIWLQ